MLNEGISSKVKMWSILDSINLDITPIDSDFKHQIWRSEVVLSLKNKISHHLFETEITNIIDDIDLSLIKINQLVNILETLHNLFRTQHSLK